MLRIRFAFAVVGFLKRVERARLIGLVAIHRSLQALQCAVDADLRGAAKAQVGLHGVARFEPRLALGRRQEDHGVVDRRGLGDCGRRQRQGARRGGARRVAVDRAGRRCVGEGGERRVALFERCLPPRHRLQLAFHLLLIEQLAAREAIDLAAQVRDAILVGELHLRLPGEQAGQYVVAERKVGGGHRGPAGHHDQRADDDPERDRADADLLSGMTKRPVAALFGRRPGRHFCLGVVDATRLGMAGPGGIRNWGTM